MKKDCRTSSAQVYLRYNINSFIFVFINGENLKSRLHVLFTASVHHFFSPKVTYGKVKGKSSLLTFIIAGKSFVPLTFTVWRIFETLRL